MRKLFSKLSLVSLLFCTLFLLTSCGLIPQMHLHGTNLLNLSDDQLFEAVYFQNLDFVYSFADEETALSQMSSARRTVYILSIYDMEIQNGGLCQFFVNSSRSLAPYVQECLAAVGAQDHLRLFSAFIADNEIDVHNLESFAITDIEKYQQQFERYDFDSFDNQYIELDLLQKFIVDYIRANIEAF